MSAPVVIVGGGPVGLTTSLLLSRLGVRNVVLERHPGTSIHPKAVGLNQRTVEILRSLGLGDAVAAAGAPPRTVSRTGWYTSLGGPTPLHGREIAVRDAWGGGQYADEYAAASPAPYTMLPQIRLEPILRAAAQARPEAQLLFDCEVVGIVPEGDGVDVVVRDALGEHVVRASYVVGADGGRTVADALGIDMSGPRDLVDMVSAHFSADLTDVLPNHECLIYWFVNPDLGGSIGSGYLYHLGPWDDEGRSAEWVFACGFGPDDPERFDEQGMRERLGRSLGVDLPEVEIHSISHWYINAVVADRFREGRCFLVGDAAHRIPPWGALGLNTGIQDAHNLAWKLAAALRDESCEPLLDTYEQERHAIARSVADSSLHNFANHGGLIDTAIGLAPGQAAAEGWAALATLWSDSPEGLAKQEALGDAVRYMDAEFHAHGAENGFAYPTGALVPDPEAQLLPDDTLVHRPTTRPGHHVPHAWLRTDRGRVSTVEIGEPGRFLLLVGAGAEGAWRAALASLSHPVAAAVDVVAVAPPGTEPGPGVVVEDGTWTRLREVSDDGAVLVRPDTMVAWRCTARPADPAGALGAALDAVVPVKEGATR
ncbi:FAD-dependent monooxygenase [Nocardioides bruguierae]|uniref:FAD-dependent monooxygenase n=1 Tax=Nocardioides bruguierae TaxID=2945102 RepID=UPI002021F1C6|nr:FAD-dependent monooxygenase [Nocardioides bruguierae]MCL8024503.1 FAD-dependent monooxygenase [Nocardioides bruguierae]